MSGGRSSGRDYGLMLTGRRYKRQFERSWRISSLRSRSGRSRSYGGGVMSYCRNDASFGSGSRCAEVRISARRWSASCQSS